MVERKKSAATGSPVTAKSDRLGGSLRPPAPAPCGTCPYRCDVPSGVWAAAEYVHLPAYDGDTWEQPTGVFLCHQQDGRICAGWAGCHDMAQSMALRLAAASGAISGDALDAVLDYASPVPLFASGQEAAQHGLADIEEPAAKAVRAIHRLEQKRGLRVREATHTASSAGSGSDRS